MHTQPRRPLLRPFPRASLPGGSVCLACLAGLAVLAGMGASTAPAVGGRAADPRPQPRIIGYYTSWSVYGRDYHVPDIPAERVTAINYAFANIADGRIALGDPYADIDRYYPGDCWDPGCLRGNFHQLQILKATHPHLRTLISVGGWTWSTWFSDVALTPASRAGFAASCVEFVTEYGFDGVDIDWEYPVSGGLPGNVYRPEDRENYTLLLAELRRQLDEAGEYLLTIAAPASPFTIDNLEVDAIHPYLDWINVMTYDFHGPWGGDADPVTHFNAPRSPASDDPLGEPFRSSFNVEAAIQAYLDRGVPGEKLHAGLPFYGRGYAQVAPSADGLFQAYAGPCPGTWEPGVLDFWDLEQNYVDRNGYIGFRHPEAGVPWLYHPAARVMISYDDSTSIAEKGRFVREAGLGGAMFWEFSADRDGVLAASIQAALSGGDPAGLLPENGSEDEPCIAILSVQPNPFGRSAEVRFVLTMESEISARIVDAAGRNVRTWTSVRLPAGQQRIVWDGRDDRGAGLPAGAYFAEIASPQARASVRITRLP